MLALLEVKDRKQPEGMPDPALMTFDEYYKVANPSNKYHSSEAYKVTGSLTYHSYQDFKPLRRFQSRGVDFELMVNQEDRYNNKYLKTDIEGNHIRDEKGNLMYLSQDEMVAKGMERYEYTFAVFRDQIAVGAAQDEWGALLIVVIQEYQGFGLGPILGKVARTMEPYADSGGFTSGGESNLVKVHREFVKDYMTNGMYSHLVRTGQITAERAKAVIASARLADESPKRSNVGPSGKPLLWSNDTNAWIIYDTALKDVMEEIQKGDLDDLFANNLIHAYCFIVGELPTYLYALDYSDPKYGKIVLQAAMAQTESHSDELRIRNENWPDELERVQELGIDVDVDEPFPKSDIPHEVFRKLSATEKRWRKSFDQYNEFEMQMMELADQLYNKKD